MATIVLIRHGITSWNNEGRVQGNSDIELDEDGINQANLLAARLRSEEWSHIYSSKLTRARQTAEIVGKAVGLEITLDTRLKERAGGQFEGTTEQERIDRWGLNWKDFDAGSEPIVEVQRRGVNFLEEINLKHQGEKVLVVTHGGVIHYSLNFLFPNIPVSHFDNTSITIVRKVNHQWTCELQNCTNHLEVNSEVR